MSFAHFPLLGNFIADEDIWIDRTLLLAIKALLPDITNPTGYSFGDRLPLYGAVIYSP